MNFLPRHGRGRRAADGARRPAPARRLRGAGLDGGERDVIIGIRPEHFEDAALVGATSATTASPSAPRSTCSSRSGSDKFAYFTVQSERATAEHLQELAADAGTGDLGAGVEGVAGDRAARRGQRGGRGPGARDLARPGEGARLRPGERREPDAVQGGAARSEAETTVRRRPAAGEAADDADEADPRPEAARLRSPAATSARRRRATISSLHSCVRIAGSGRTRRACRPRRRCRGRRGRRRAACATTGRYSSANQRRATSSGGRGSALVLCTSRKRPGLDGLGELRVVPGVADADRAPPSRRAAAPAGGTGARSP